MRLQIKHFKVGSDLVYIILTIMYNVCCDDFQTQEYKFRLHENPDYGWQPRLSARDFISVLANLTAIKVRGTYTCLLYTSRCV